MFFHVLLTMSVAAKETGPFKTMSKNRHFSLYKLFQTFVEVMECYHFTDEKKFFKRTCLVLQGLGSVESGWDKKGSLCIGRGRLFGGR